MQRTMVLTGVAVVLAATVGLAFTKVRPGVQRQITQLCRIRAPLGVDI